MAEMSRVDQINEVVLDQIMYPYLGTGATFMNDLTDLGKLLFKKKYIGTFASDKIPIIKNNQYMILNLDTSKMQGSHWIAVARLNDKLYVYDSFGRNTNSIIPALQKKYRNIKIIESLRDVDQDSFTEFDCGQRSLAWLFIVDHWGIDMALKL